MEIRKEMERERKDHSQNLMRYDPYTYGCLTSPIKDQGPHKMKHIFKLNFGKATFLAAIYIFSRCRIRIFS